MFEQYIEAVVAFVRDHAVWAAPVVFALAFAESLAFISLLVPAWGALVLIGTIVQAGGLNFWPIWIAGSVGAAGRRHFQDAVLAFSAGELQLRLRLGRDADPARRRDRAGAAGNLEVGR